MACVAPLALEELAMSLYGEKGLPGVFIETPGNPIHYTDAQLNTAMRIAWALRRGRFLLLEPPEGS